MIIGYTRLAAAASLLTLSLSATAATVIAESYLVTQSANNVLNPPGCTTGSTTFTECVHVTQSIGLGAPLTTTGTVTTLRSTFDAAGLPNFVMNGNAHASASFGHLHASAFVQVQGKGGDNVSVGGRSYAQVTDRVTIQSSVLPVGTPVSIKVLMDVNGHGGGALYFGLSRFQKVVQANDIGFPADSLDDYETTFSAKVGDKVTVSYGLMAYTRVFSTLWRPIDVLNGRNNNADYGNSAYIYMGGVDPALDITLQSDSGGFLYPIPSAVPEPDAAWLLLIGLSMLAWRARRASPAARGCPPDQRR